jgi:hypothetical protein
MDEFIPHLKPHIYRSKIPKVKIVPAQRSKDRKTPSNISKGSPDHKYLPSYMRRDEIKVDKTQNIDES